MPPAQDYFTARKVFHVYRFKNLMEFYVFYCVLDTVLLAEVGLIRVKYYQVYECHPM